MDLLREHHELPIQSTFLVWAQFVELSGTTPERVGELVDMGWLKPTRTAEEALLFRQADVYRLRKLERLCADFELPILGGTIVVDLLDRVEALERQVRLLTRQG